MKSWIVGVWGDYSPTCLANRIWFCGKFSCGEGGDVTKEGEEERVTTAARRHGDLDDARRAHLCHQPGQRAAVPEPVRAHRRRTEIRDAGPRAVRRAHGDDAAAHHHPGAKPGPAHRRRTPPRPASPVSRPCRADRPHATRRRRTTALLRRGPGASWHRLFAVRIPARPLTFRNEQPPRGRVPSVAGTIGGPGRGETTLVGNRGFHFGCQR